MIPEAPQLRPGDLLEHQSGKLHALVLDKVSDREFETMDAYIFREYTVSVLMISETRSHITTLRFLDGQEMVQWRWLSRLS